ncbi:glucosamine-6-phosphate deaminase [Erysipelatoclostridium sp. AM42-17]|uniref:glucosamine-6-phosphate deaminase n=1 Tax=Erysipelatoclostridium sp. AM42-17 TaxID=2293102 RepID=UPI000E5064E6|nr:glucosamine-6-phosphate deaminase [Erysipelatoclostridium sp. AM42-17]RHS96054.1 glucosamine-6-phosphate deaminase [Erysipelatoclostridium sp. AM42-17]
MKVIVAENREIASQEGAKIIIDQVKNNPETILGLATGTTPIDLYNNMVKDHKENGTDYSKVKSYNLDEYVGLDGTHPQSYYCFMFEHLFNHININPENVHVPVGKGDLQAACNAYNDALKQNQVDIQLLGIGSNGHIGFNEPGTPADSVTHVVDLKESTIKDNARLFFNGDEDAVPKQAVSMGIANIMNAKKVLLLAFGEGKAKAVKGMLEGEVTPELPASILQNHPDVTVIVDKAAASLLEKQY